MKKAAGILFTDGEKILLLKRASGDHSGTWAIAGGKAHEDETPHENAVREAQEEIGSVKGAPFAEYCDGTFTAFLYRVKKPFSPKLNKEHSSHEWVKLENVEDKDLHPQFRKAWPTYMKKIKKVRPGSFKEWMLFKHVGW